MHRTGDEDFSKTHILSTLRGPHQFSLLPLSRLTRATGVHTKKNLNNNCMMLFSSSPAQLDPVVCAGGMGLGGGGSPLVLSEAGNWRDTERLLTPDLF